jgi:hypothetical protein
MLEVGASRLSSFFLEVFVHEFSVNIEQDYDYPYDTQRNEHEFSQVCDVELRDGFSECCAAQT